MEKIAQTLDRAIPLAGASHADVVDYAIAIPMRYAECVATLKDGRQVRLRKPEQLIGWSGSDKRRTILFKNGARGFELTINSARRRRVRSLHSCRLEIVAPHSGGRQRPRKLISRDGSLAYVRQHGRSILAALPRRFASMEQLAAMTANTGKFSTITSGAMA